ncbi:class I SAM-dependent methyltransferase family protein [Candidatus Woesearchaeota archaeon]|nr:class I SAM-dependent methyltransferase family protein [Candidatus Woesearchaeota archaeon]
MVLTVKVKSKDTQKIKKVLIDKGIFNQGYKVKREKGFVYLPVLKRITKPKLEFADKKLDLIERKGSLQSILAKDLTSKELEAVPSAFDIVGDIAILEIKDEIKKHEKLVAQTLLKLHKNIKTVVKKASIHGGEFRTQKMKHLAGEQKKIAVHRESGVLIKLDVEKVYFSARLSNERLRIANLVKKGEDVLVMFSGCAPYPLVIAKNSPAKHIVGIEKNPTGHKYALENLKLNKGIANKIELFKGDVRKIIPKLNRKFDRIVMPLPKSAEDFLPDALKAAKKGAVIHLYDFLDEKDIPDAAIEKIRKHVHKFKVLKIVKCGQFSPSVYRICVDFRLE